VLASNAKCLSAHIPPAHKPFAHMLFAHAKPNAAQSHIWTFERRRFFEPHKFATPNRANRFPFFTWEIIQTQFDLENELFLFAHGLDGLRGRPQDCRGQKRTHPQDLERGQNRGSLVTGISGRWETGIIFKVRFST
jgi:hypothetical protein